MVSTLVNEPHQVANNVVKQLLTADHASFAVGHLFMSGLAPIAERLENIDKLRILVQSTDRTETLDQIAEACRRLDRIDDHLQRQQHPKRSEKRAACHRTTEQIESQVGEMDQTDSNQALLTIVRDALAAGRLEVRAHVRGPLESKAYLFEKAGRIEGAIVGSTNALLASAAPSTLLDQHVEGKQETAALRRWFDGLWKKAMPLEEFLQAVLENSWALRAYAPHDIYLKTMFELVRGTITDDDEAPPLVDELSHHLTEFQLDAVESAVSKISRFQGCLVSDVVGLGKTFVGAAIIKRYELTHDLRSLIVCPKSLESMWQGYVDRFHLRAKVVPMSVLREDEDDPSLNVLDDDATIGPRDFVLIDEAHNFRNPNTQRYRQIQSFLDRGYRCVLVTATPQNRSAMDIYHQLRLFMPEEATARLGLPWPSLREFFRAVEDGTANLRELLSHVLIRRTRSRILYRYGFDAETHRRLEQTCANDDEGFEPYRRGERQAYITVGGNQQFFPTRELNVLRYDLDEGYAGTLDQLLYIISGRATADAPALAYARYSLGRYVRAEHRNNIRYAQLQNEGPALRGLMRVMLFKRLESSSAALHATVDRQIVRHNGLADSVRAGSVPIGRTASRILESTEDIDEALEHIDDGELFPAAHFNAEQLLADLDNDIHLLESMASDLSAIERDTKLDTLLKLLRSKAIARRKVLIFSQFADTVAYLKEQLKGRFEAVESVTGSGGNKLKMIQRFAPFANDYRLRDGEEIMTLVASDAFSEGLNLQDCNIIVNYDLHWNPVRLIQRFGRVDRIGTRHDQVLAYNFLPERRIEQTLGIEQVLRRRIRDIHHQLGEDSSILHPNEQLNEEALYDIYERGLVNDDTDSVDADPHAEAEEIFRRMRREEPEEFDRIRRLPDGIRGAYPSASTDGTYAFFRAGRDLVRLLILDADGANTDKTAREILSAIRAEPDTPTGVIPEGYNRRLHEAFEAFEAEAAEWAAQKKTERRRSIAQRYVLKKLEAMNDEEADDAVKAAIGALHRVFSRTLTVAVERELLHLRRRKVVGRRLLDRLQRIFQQHSLGVARARVAEEEDGDLRAQIICSEWLEL